MGAATSVLLIAGLGYWVFDLATRDVSKIPVIEAMGGPARVAPEDPGGFEAAHQGYAVNSIASDDEQTPLAERVVLAPDAVEPSPEDKAPGEPVDPLASMRDAVEGALSEVLQDESEAARQTPLDALSPQASQIPIAPRPTPRPDRDVVTRAAANASPALLVPVSAGSVTDMDPAQIPSGARLVQLGDYATEQDASAAWDQLALAFGDFLGPKARVIEPMTVSGTTRYRLRAYGFDGLVDARNFCAALLAEQAECIPVRMR